MQKKTSSLRLAALGALVLGFACAGFVANASAEDVTSNDTAKDVTDTADGGGGFGGHGGHGNHDGHGGGGSNGRNPAGGIGSGGNPTGEGALLEGNCFGDMAVYNKEGKYVGRGMINTCN